MLRKMDLFNDFQFSPIASTYTRSFTRFWIGGHRSGECFTWMDGTDISSPILFRCPMAGYQNWSPGQPDFANINELCLETDQNLNWNDVDCHIRQRFICEML